MVFSHHYYVSSLLHFSLERNPIVAKAFGVKALPRLKIPGIALPFSPQRRYDSRSALTGGYRPRGE